MSAKSAGEANLQYDGKSISLPVVEGSEGERGVDISRLRADTGLITLDPGYGNTGSCQSSVTFIDGEKGILRYRGYPIEELAEKSTFLEVAYLLIHGELPNEDQRTEFDREVTLHTMLHEDFKKFFSAMPKSAHPMPVTAAAVAALATFYPEPETEEMLQRAVVRLIAKYSTLAAFAYKHSLGQPFMYPRNSLDYASNFLHMMFSVPCEEYEVDPVVARALDLLADLARGSRAELLDEHRAHGRQLAGASLFASVSAGISGAMGRAARRREPARHRNARADRDRRGRQR